MRPETRSGDALPEDSPLPCARAAPIRLADAVRAGRRPPALAVTGRPGSGRSTLARAIRQVLSVDAGVTAGAAPDLWCHTLSGPPRAADRQIIAGLPGDRTVVVLTKADVFARAGTDSGAQVAARCADDLGRPVIAVSGLWAGAAPTRAQVGLLAALAAAGERVPEMAGRFVVPTGIGGGDEESLRTQLLRVMGASGIGLVLRELGAGRIDADPGRVAGLLRAASGIGAVRDAIDARMGSIERARTVELAAAAERIAARGTERADAERLLARLGSIR